MLDISVQRRPHLVETVDGKRFHTHPLRVGVWGTGAPLNRCRIAKKVTDIRLWTRWRFWPKQVPLDRTFKTAIVDFLNGYHGRSITTFTCYSFAATAKGMPLHNVCDYSSYWESADDGSIVNIGETLFFFDTEARMFRHAALHIGNGYFLSVLGGGGDLEVHHYSEMSAEFEADAALHKRPKLQPSA